MASGFFVHMDEVLTRLMNASVNGLSDQLSASVLTLTGSATTIYVLYYGYLTLAGKKTTPIEDLTLQLTLIAIIMSVLANFNGILTSTQDAINGLKEGIGTQQNIWETLDALWDKTQQVADKIYEMDTDYIPMKGAVGMVAVWAGSIIVMAITALTTLVAQTTLFLLSVISPLFIFCLAWGWFRSMFTNYLEAIVSSFLTIVLVGVFVTASTYVLTGVLTQSTSNPDVNILTPAGQILITGIICAGLTLIAPGMAGKLSGAAINQVMQSMASRGLSLAGGGAKNQLDKALGGSKADKAGWDAANAGKKDIPAGGTTGYRAAQARQAAMKQMQDLVERRRSRAA
ncbi:type IV secretion system protein [Kosakonia radicincitans]|uniref:type IV secretion system protein n=1 Tax=Kosakonia radicincitans TaxID=283686 RepID=UPI0008CE0E92|nr:type IV secretion system protein [Kosakonia radicincitans]SET71053.1 type IV secretion system protein VirB6 [Kosakonia radicincitans]